MLYVLFSVNIISIKSVLTDSNNASHLLAPSCLSSAFNCGSFVVLSASDWQARRIRVKQIIMFTFRVYVFLFDKYNVTQIILIIKQTVAVT